VSADNISQPSRPEAPSPEVMKAALDLMTTLGAKDKAAWGYVTALKKAREHNDEVLADIQKERAQLGDLTKREADVARREAELAAKLAKYEAVRESVLKATGQ